MFFELVASALLGIACGVFCGLVPGIHPNTLILILMGALPFLLSLGLSVQALVTLIVSMVIVNTLVSFIPSVYLGAPEDDGALSVLPGHRLLLEGKGLEAIWLTVVGGVGVVILFVLLFPLLSHALPIIYASVKYYIHWLLLAVLAVMSLTERGFGRLWSLLVFLLSGALGLLIFNSPTLYSPWILFPAFTGLFGISTLLISLKSKTKIPKQAEGGVEIENSTSLWGTLKGFGAGLVVGILPGVGSAQAGALIQVLTRRWDVREFLVSLGGINTANALFALAALYLIGRPRSGAAIAVEKILGNFTLNDLFLVMATSLFCVGVGALLTLWLSKRMLALIQRVPYDKLSLSVLGMLVMLTYAFTGLLGLAVLGVSTAIGLLAPLTGVRRSTCMGVVMLPVICWYASVRF